LVRLRIRERAGKLMEVSEAIETIEEMASAFRTGLQGMGARCTRDLVLRRTIDDVAREILTELADKAAQRSAELEPKDEQQKPQLELED